MTKIQTFINYLHVRFQIIPLIVLLFTDLIVIKRITNDYIIPDWKLYTCFLFTLIYLFHNRVADDKRDFDFDLEHYPDRHVQSGQLDIHSMIKVSYFLIGLMILIAIGLGRLSQIIFLPLIVYTLVAKKDFFLPDDFKIKRLFTYNFINMLQLLFLQIFVYVSILNSFQINKTILIHIIFVFLLSIQVEITRKIKPTLSSGSELYSDRLTMKGSLILWGVSGALCGLACVWLSSLIQIDISKAIAFVIAIQSFSFLTGYLFYIYKNSKFENLFWLGLISSYVLQNMVLIYG